MRQDDETVACRNSLDGDVCVCLQFVFSQDNVVHLFKPTPKKVPRKTFMCFLVLYVYVQELFSVHVVHVVELGWN